MMNYIKRMEDEVKEFEASFPAPEIEKPVPKPTIVEVETKMENNEVCITKECNDMVKNRMEALIAAGISAEKLSGMSVEKIEELAGLLGVEKDNVFDKRQLRIIEKYGDKSEEIRKHVTPDMELTEIVFIANSIVAGKDISIFKGVHDIDMLKFLESIPKELAIRINANILSGKVYNLSLLSWIYNNERDKFEDILPFVDTFDSFAALCMFLQIVKFNNYSVTAVYNKYGTNIYDLMFALDRQVTQINNSYYVVPTPKGYDLVSE